MEEYLTQHISSAKYKKLVSYISDYDNYEQILYDIAGQLTKNVPYKTILSDVQQQKFRWNSSIYGRLAAKRYSKDQLLENPPKIKDGDIPCKKCGLKKTIIFEMQTRSADEPCTYEIRCFNPSCKAVRKTDNF
jgi:DNA-directed RNA polymerase subunit M/transcription elongation factor TFIIS